MNKHECRHMASPQCAEFTKRLTAEIANAISKSAEFCSTDLSAEEAGDCVTVALLHCLSRAVLTTREVTGESLSAHLLHHLACWITAMEKYPIYQFDRIDALNLFEKLTEEFSGTATEAH
jgi:hypothetical protein